MRTWTKYYVLFACGAVPLLFFLHTGWGHAVLLGYALTAMFVAMLREMRPPEPTKWFWKSIVLMAIIHSSIIAGLIWLDLAIPGINRQPRALYGFAGLLLAAEWWLAIRIMDAFASK